MELDRELYNQLRDLRMYIKQDGKRLTGIAPSVCSDETLINITKSRPRRIEDFAAIPGVGEVFIKKYAHFFLEVIALYEETEGEEKMRLSEHAVETMRSLEEKLVNINRRNRLIYMPRLYAKSDFDLFSEKREDIVDFLFNADNSSYTVCDASAGDEEACKDYKNLVTLLRTINREINEKGINNLYVAYPFVKGCLKDTSFKIRCPLALFPVRAERSGKKIAIFYDETRDVLFNRTLILAQYKAERQEKNLPDTAFEGSGKEEFIKGLLEFYGKNGIKIKECSDGLKKFTEYTKDTFPQYESYEMNMEANAVLGRFSICDSAIMHDFDELIARGKINTFLGELLAGAEELEDKPWLNKGVAVEDEVFTDIHDKDITYISNVDASQEKVLQAVRENEKIVVQGPPGTGKSQVITNLIAGAATEGKTVLLVSEKKTALDVVYSRLGDLSKYALLIDDIGNKTLFYKQIAAMKEVGSLKSAGTNEAFRAGKNIDVCFDALRGIEKALYSVGEFGVEPYKLFLMTEPDDKSEQGVLKTNYLRTAWTDIPEELLVANYSELKHINNVLNQEAVKKNVSEYMQLLKDYPFLANAKRGLDTTKYSRMTNELVSLACDVNGAEFRAFPRGRLRKLRRPARKFAMKYFASEQETVAAILLTEPDVVRKALSEEYGHYLSLSDTIDSYENIVKLYVHTLHRLRKKSGEDVVDNNFLFDSIVRYHIDRFMNEYREEVEAVGGFKSIIRQINQYVSAKEDYSKQYLESLLSEYIGRMTCGKRGEEIDRIATGSRKWNVNRFLNKYSYEVFNAVKIWLLTPEVVSEIIPLNTGVFDLVIFDEASQMFVEKGIPAIYRAKKVVIAGDSKQLRPNSLGMGRIDGSIDNLPDDESETEDRTKDGDSLLELARYKYPDIWLNYHYRAKRDELISFSNYAFYEGKLRIAPNVGKTSKPAIEYIHVEDGCWTNQSNLNEAKRVVALLKEQLKSKRPETTIGVITFNASQRELILDLIDEECDASEELRELFEREMNRSDSGEDKGLFVKNVESVQGDERDIIIFSIGYAPNEDGKFIRNFGWLNQEGGENRLNVAITRAKLKEFVVCSLAPDEFDVEGTKNEGPKYLKKFLQYAKSVSDGQRELAKNILDSMHQKDTYAKRIRENKMTDYIYTGLRDKLPKQYEVKKNPLVEEDGISLVVYKNGQVIMGIEYDTIVYPAYPDTRERDFHRYRFLSTKGWTIYRVFTLDWWRDSEGTLDALADHIKSI